MKILGVFLLTVLTTLYSKAQEFPLTYSNISVSIPGVPGAWIKNNGKFYCYFETDNGSMSTAATNHFYILDTEGTILKKVELPEELHTIYYDLYLKNDTLFTTDYYKQHTFYLDEKEAVWKATNKNPHIYYQDELYVVYSMDFGEWGAVTWFEDRQTGKQYEVYAKTPVVNRFENTYYLISDEEILKISDPKKLEESTDPYNYEKYTAEKKHFREGSFSFKGAVSVKSFEASIIHKPTPKTSFLLNNELYFLFEEQNKTGIYVLENGKINLIWTLQPNMHLYRRYYDTRNPIWDKNQQSMQFVTDQSNVYGIIAVDGKKMELTSFTNTFAEPVATVKEMTMWFEETFDTYHSNFSSLSIDHADAVEKKEHATDLTQRHKITHYLLDGKDLETPRIYRKYEGDDLQLITNYYYWKQGGKVELVNFEWNRHNNQLQSFIEMQEYEAENPRIRQYKEKFEQLAGFLKRKLGTPHKVLEESDESEMVWQEGNIITELRYTAYTVEVTIYKKK